MRRGVSLLIRDSAGCSALHIAAQDGHTDLVSFILQQGETVHDVCIWVNVCEIMLKVLYVAFSFPLVDNL